MILITGGTGYIGSHTALACLAAGKKVVIYDDLSNSDLDVIRKLELIAHQMVPFIKGDILNTAHLSEVMQDYSVTDVIHFAGLKSVADSADQPLRYYSSNVQGSLSLLFAMELCNIKKLVFSSSAAVYGIPSYLPYDEAHPTAPLTTYGRTKLHVEHMLQDVVTADNAMRIMCLRYFNPIGAHDSGLIGENPNGTPNNLMPYMQKVATGLLSHLNIYGNDYPTKDGTGERDYLHIMDLADAHLMALDYVDKNIGYSAVNIGTGVSYSVLDIIKTFEEVSGKRIRFRIAPRRKGDLPSYFSNSNFAKELMGWKSNRDLTAMCKSAWDYYTKYK